MQQNTSFIVIDDSREDCYLIKKRLQTINKSFNVKSFLSAQDAYDYIYQAGVNILDPTIKSIIILDIYMPIMDGFEFVEEFEKLANDIQESYLICALTSSINKTYIDKISNYKSVKFFLEKPIKTESLLHIIAS